MKRHFEGEENEVSSKRRKTIDSLIVADSKFRDQTKRQKEALVAHREAEYALEEAEGELNEANEQLREYSDTVLCLKIQNTFWSTVDDFIHGDRLHKACSKHAGDVHEVCFDDSIVRCPGCMGLTAASPVLTLKRNAETGELLCMTEKYPEEVHGAEFEDGGIMRLSLPCQECARLISSAATSRNEELAETQGLLLIIPELQQIVRGYAFGSLETCFTCAEKDP